MTVHNYEQAQARDELILAVLRAIAADHYAREDDPHADAESEYAGEKLALAARDLVRAVDALPESDQPIGWGKQSEPVSHAEAMSAVPVPIETKPVREYRFPGDVMGAPHNVPQF